MADKTDYEDFEGAMAEKAEPPKKEKKEKSVDYLDGQTEEQYCSWVDSQIRQHPVVLNHHGKWREHIEWVDGQQYTIWDDGQHKLRSADLRIRKRKIVINLLKPLIEALDGKINFGYGIIGVPNSGQETDIRGARAATRMLAFNDEVAGREDVMQDVKWDMLLTGQGCEKWAWDKEIEATAQGKNEDGSTYTIPEKGDVDGEYIPIFNIRPDPTATSMRNSRWLIEIKEVTKSGLIETFPDLTEKDIESMVQAKASRYEGMYKKDEDIQDEEDTYIFAEMWERPGEKFKNGRLVQSCGSKVLYKGENPSPKRKRKNKAGDLPYFVYYYKKDPYSFWGRGPIHFVQDLQRNANRMISMAVEHVEAWRPKMAIPPNSLRRQNSFTVDNFELLEVDDSRGAIHPITMPQLDPQVMALYNLFTGGVNTVSNVHEVSYSQLPEYASRAPASLYAMMLEQETQKLERMVSMTNKTLKDQASFRLMLMAKYYKTQRYVKIFGKSKESIAQFLSGTDINSNFDVNLQPGVSINQSTSVQTEMYMKLFEKGIVPKTDARRILRVLNLGTAEYEIRTDVVDDERAVRENQAFIDGRQTTAMGGKGVKVLLHDDHELHLERHTNLLKSEEAEVWEQTQFDALQSHIEEHYNYVMMLKQAMMTATETAKGAPTPAGEAGMPGEAAPEGGEVMAGPEAGAPPGGGTAPAETSAL